MRNLILVRGVDNRHGRTIRRAQAGSRASTLPAPAGCWRCDPAR